MARYQAPLDIGGRDCPPDYRHVLFIEGEFLPVTTMYDSEREPTADPRNAFVVVAYGGRANWRVYQVSPGEVEHREDFEARTGCEIDTQALEMPKT